MSQGAVAVPRLTWVLCCGALGLATVGYFLGIDPLQGEEQTGLTLPTGSASAAPAGEAATQTPPSPRTASDGIRAGLGPFVPSQQGPNARLQSDLRQLRAPTTLADPSLAADPVAREASLARRALRRSFNGAPPTIPHAIAERDARACLACHGSGLAIGDRVAPRMPHELYGQCTQCHVENSSEPPPFAQNLFQGLPAPSGGERAGPEAPPQIPHSTLQRTDCLACHGPLGAAGMRTTHPERSQCLQCHAVNAVLDQVVAERLPPPGIGQ